MPHFFDPNTYLLTGNDNYLIIGMFLVALLLSLIASKLSIQIAKAIGLIDFPHREPHKVHRAAVPIAGGLAIFLTLLPLVSFVHFSGIFQIDHYLFTAFLLIFVIGMLDDLTNLPPKTKLLGQIAASLLLVCGNHHAAVFDSHFLNIVISIAWYVGIMNAFNFIDSADGLLVGICIIIVSSITLATLHFAQPGLNFLSIGISGSLVGLFLFNKKPAKLFLGDSGALILGLLFAVIALKFNPLGFDPTTSWMSPILMMAIPIFDATLVIISRFRRKKPLDRAGLDHTFHRLKRHSKKENYPYLIIFGTTVVANIVAIGNLFLPPALSFTLFGTVHVFGVLLVILFEKFLPAENPHSST
jgi:UDP-GlcNAc:undecaprenyl-phosphate GlcNAc-1-phosphate transferase